MSKHDKPLAFGSHVAMLFLTKVKEYTRNFLLESLFFLGLVYGWYGVLYAVFEVLDWEVLGIMLTLFYVPIFAYALPYPFYYLAFPLRLMLGIEITFHDWLMLNYPPN